MQTLSSLKRTIDRAQELQSVVRTMKTLAAVSIRQYEHSVASLIDFAETVELGLRMVLWNVPPGSLVIKQKTEHATGAIVFGSDQGMCGQFNEQIGSFAEEEMRHYASAGEPLFFMTVGSRATGRLLDAGFEVDLELTVPGSATGITPLVVDLLARIDRWRTEKRLGKIIVMHNRPATASSCRPHKVQLLPVDPEQFARTEQKWPSRTLPTYTMNRNALLSRLIRQHLFITLFRASAESLASENASRIVSMHAAERNIQERLGQLRHEYHQQRQTSITEELLDVLTGFEAIGGSTPG